MTEPIRKACYKCPSGYEWKLAGEIAASCYGAPVDPNEWILLQKSESREISSPPDDLFAKFARLDLTRERILDFANSYGTISLRAIDFHQPSRGRAIGGFQSDWVEAKRSFAPAFLIWRAIYEAEHGDSNRLERYVSWQRSRAVFPAEVIALLKDFVVPGPDWEDALIQIPELSYSAWPPGDREYDELKKASGGDRLRPAREFLRRATQTRVEVGMDFTPEGILERVFQTPDLRSLLWFQLIEAASGGSNLRPCKNPECPELIWISPRGKGNRRNRETCSDACRFAIYESRKQKTFELFLAGRHTLKQIAEAISDDPDDRPDFESVLRWIARELFAAKSSLKQIASRLKISEAKARALVARKKRQPRLHIPKPKSKGERR